MLYSLSGKIKESKSYSLFYNWYVRIYKKQRDKGLLDFLDNWWDIDFSRDLDDAVFRVNEYISNYYTKISGLGANDLQRGCALIVLHALDKDYYEVEKMMYGEDYVSQKITKAREHIITISENKDDVLWLDSQLWMDNSAEPQKDVECESPTDQAAITDVSSDQLAEIKEEKPKKRGAKRKTTTIEKVCPERAAEFRARVEKIVDKESPQEYLDIAKDLGIPAKAMKFCVANDLGYPGGESDVRKWNSARKKREDEEEIERKKKEKQATARE